MSYNLKISKAFINHELIKFRPAKPDLKEGLLFAKLFDEASEGFFSSILGEKTYEIIADAFVKPNNDYSFENVMIIEYKDKIAGILSGYTLAEKEGFTKNVLFEYPEGPKFKIRIFTVIGKFLSRFLGPHGKEDFYIQAITVIKEMRGKGLGQMLMQKSLEIANAKGAKTISLDVSSKNKNAIKSYTKFGMKTFAFWPNFLKLPPVFTRMTKEVD